MSVTLVVERYSAKDDEQGRCLVCLDPEVMEAAKIKAGDVVRIRPVRGRSILARVDHARVADTGRGIIGMDRFVRQATRARLGERVEVERVEAGVVKQVTLVPAVDVSTAHDLEAHLSEMFSRLLPPVSIGSILYGSFHHSTAGIAYRVDELQDGPGIITGETGLRIDYSDSKMTEVGNEITYEDIGGLGAQIKLVRELVELPLQLPHVYRRLGIIPPKGIIFYGPPGSGKTHLARAISNEMQANFYYINGPELIGTLYGETEANLRKIFNEATHHAPSVILIDELDALAPKRGETGSHSDTRMVTQLLSLLDGLQRVDGVIVIGATNRIDSLDTALRRPGRFDREVFVGPPDAGGRKEILQIHCREMPLSSETEKYLDGLAGRTHGFVGADLMELCREAGLNSMRRSAAALRDHLDSFHDLDHVDIFVEQQDFDAALAQIRPSAMREALVTIPKVTWEDIGGLTAVKERLRELIEYPLQRAADYAALGLSSTSGILLYGPPGTGKTLLAQAVASQIGINFIAVEGPEIFSKWLGESEEAIRHIFRVARQLAPSLIFFDQLDALAPARGTHDSGTKTTERVVNQLLAEMDGVEPLSNIIVMAATNRIDLVDESMLRPGRLGTHIYVPLPDQQARTAIVRAKLRNVPIVEEITATEIAEWVAGECDGLSGAEVSQVCQEAKLHALSLVTQQGAVKVALTHFADVIASSKQNHDRQRKQPGRE